jgi:hypothetical protein
MNQHHANQSERGKSRDEKALPAAGAIAPIQLRPLTSGQLARSRAVGRSHGRL